MYVHESFCFFTAYHPNERGATGIHLIASITRTHLMNSIAEYIKSLTIQRTYGALTNIHVSVHTYLHVYVFAFDGRQHSQQKVVGGGWLLAHTFSV